MLIDTNVWSELSRPSPDARVVDWMSEHFDECILSAVVLGEIRYGIALALGTRQRELEAFLDDLLDRLKDRIADFDAAAANAWGPMRAKLKRNGQLFGERDMLLAAQAISLRTPLVTRNVAELARSEADIINPWGN